MRPEALAEATGRNDHRVAVVLGSGLSDIARDLTGAEPIPYGRIEGMPASAVVGHEGALYSGIVGAVPALVFAGRVHLYEGHGAGTVTAPVRGAVKAGCHTVILTNAAGAIDYELEIGAPCLISDHLNLTGHNPLIGPHDGDGPRFLDMTHTYDRGLRSLAKEIDPDLKEAVYAGLIGPTYETPAEVRMLRAMGAELVGMSTVLEATMARYLGARVLGVSVVTNLAAGLSDRALSHEDVAASGKRAADRLTKILEGVISGL